MNKVGAISGSKDFSPFQNHADVLQGTIHLTCNHVTSFVGLDLSYKFGQTLKLANGAFLEIASSDLMCRVQIVTKSSDGSDQIEFKELPSSLFVQARRGDTICYLDGSKKYELLLAPSTNEQVSFDEALGSIEKNKNNSKRFYDLLNPAITTCVFDQPTDHLSVQLLAQLSDQLYVASPCNEKNAFIKAEEYLSIVSRPKIISTFIKRGTELFPLSTETRCIKVGQLGAKSINSDDFEMFDVCETIDSKPYKVMPSDTGYLILFEVCGNPGDSDLEILLDGNELYVTQASTEVLASLPHTFAYVNINCGSKKIDESNISAWLHEDHGFLFVQLPFVNTLSEQQTIQTPSQDRKPRSVIDFDKVETTAITTSTTSTSTWVNIDYNVGCENTLGVCCEPSWGEAPIAFRHNGTDWSGQVPVGKDWKFVILHNGHVAKWENGNNRKCDGKASSFSIDPNTLNFS